MRSFQRTHSESARQSTWAISVADALGLSDFSAALGRIALARCLLFAAALRVTLSAVARLVGGCGRETLRKGLLAGLPTEPRLVEDRFAAAFRAGLRRRDRRRAVPLAVDLHKRPYYGDHDRTPGVTGGKRERGTSWFYAYATAVVLRRGHRHTLALTAVEPKETFAAILRRLLAHVAASGVRVRYVLLDRSFYAAEVFDLLAARGLRFVVPVLRRAPTERFFRRGMRGWFEHTVRSRSGEHRVALRLAVMPHPDGRRRPLVFACSGGFSSVPRVLLRYRRRFGIESSYRQVGQALGQTTSRLRVYRLLLVGLSLLIRAWSVLGRVRLWTIRLQLILAFSRPLTNTTGSRTQTVPPHEPVTP
jgi:hypothetical protein